MPDDLARIAREFDLGGVILFERNVEAPVQVAELAHDVQALREELPLWVSVDQEGGRVARLRTPFTVWPPMQLLGRSGDAGLARRFARALASELRAVGVTLDYAPVLDVHTNPRNPVIGDRALSDDPVVVARLGRVLVEELQAGGVAACGKHFPGHGDTAADSHHTLPVVEHPPDRIRAVELEPFRAAIQADVALIMTAHVSYPALDQENPATLSRVIVRDLLRRELGFGGVIATDDMHMKALAGDRTIANATVDAVAAGCDLVLLCAPEPAEQVAALEALIRAVELDVAAERRVEDALERGRRAKERFLTEIETWRPPGPRALEGSIGTAEHEAVAAEMRLFA